MGSNPTASATNPSMSVLFSFLSGRIFPQLIAGYGGFSVGKTRIPPSIACKSASRLRGLRVLFGLLGHQKKGKELGRTGKAANRGCAALGGSEIPTLTTPPVSAVSGYSEDPRLSGPVQRKVVADARLAWDASRTPGL